MNKLRQYIREMVETELDEMARIATMITIGDDEAAEAAKELHAGTWVGDLIQTVQDAGEAGIDRPALAKALGMQQQGIQKKMVDFIESGVLKTTGLKTPKKEKPATSGVKGRPTSEKTLMAKAVASKMQADGNYEPTEDELEMLGPEAIEIIRKRVKGLLRRGRPLGASKAKDGMTAAPKTAVDAKDADMDGDVDDEDLDLELEESISLNESFLRMQKLAGLITENELKKKLKEIARINDLPFTDKFLISNQDQAEKYKEKFKNSWKEELIKTIQDADKTGINREELAKKIGKNIMEVTSELRILTQLGIIVKQK